MSRGVRDGAKHVAAFSDKDCSKCNHAVAKKLLKVSSSKFKRPEPKEY